MSEVNKFIKALIEKTMCMSQYFSRVDLYWHEVYVFVVQEGCDFQ